MRNRTAVLGAVVGVLVMGHTRRALAQDDIDFEPAPAAPASEPASEEPEAPAIRKRGPKGPRFRGSDPEPLIGIGIYGFGVRPTGNRALGAAGGGLALRTITLIPTGYESLYASIVRFDFILGGFSPVGISTDLRFSIGFGYAFSSLYLGGLVGLGLDGMGRIGADKDDVPRIPTALEAHAGVLLRLKAGEKVNVDVVGQLDRRSCTDGPFEVCSLTRLDAHLDYRIDSKMGVFVGLGYDPAPFATVWTLTVGIAPHPG